LAPPVGKGLAPPVGKRPGSHREIVTGRRRWGIICIGLGEIGGKETGLTGSLHKQNGKKKGAALGCLAPNKGHHRESSAAVLGRMWSYVYQSWQMAGADRGPTHTKEEIQNIIK
jgi:hypothetical protein